MRNTTTILLLAAALIMIMFCCCTIDNTVEELKAGSYVIRLIEPYAGLEKQIVFRADLPSCPEGSFSVIRHRYPWNG